MRGRMLHTSHTSTLINVRSSASRLQGGGATLRTCNELAVLKHAKNKTVNTVFTAFLCSCTGYTAVYRKRQDDNVRGLTRHTQYRGDLSFSENYTMLCAALCARP